MSKLDVIIRGGTLVTHEGERTNNIGIADGKIVALEASLQDVAREIVDANGLHIFPGLIDAHVHFNDPGRAHWEGIRTGSRALAAGGGTMFFDMPLNSSPPTLNGKSFDAKLAVAKKTSFTDFALWGGLTPGNLNRLEELAARGVVGFKAFMSSSGIEDFACVDDATLRKGMKRAAKLGKLVAVHAESETITSDLARKALAQNRTSIRDYLDSRPVRAELEAIQRAIALAAETGCGLHIVHVSCGAGAAFVAAARRQGVDVTCETCPHYLVLTEEDVEKLGAVAKCTPPLRTKTAQDSLWEQVCNGAVKTIGSDHSPSPPAMKQDKNFFKIWGGISGGQHTLPLLLTSVAAGILPAVEPGFQPGGTDGDKPKRSKRFQAEANLDAFPDGKMPPSTASRMPAATPLPLIARLTSLNVAERFHLPKTKGHLAIGADADLALVDLKAKLTVRAKDLWYRHQQSPYVGRALTGRVVRTILRGRTVFHHGRLIGPPAGRFVNRDGVKTSQSQIKTNMPELFGFTRTVVKSRYALITPDGFVPSVLSGWKNSVCVVNISPVMIGPRFTQLHVTVSPDGVGEGNTGTHQYFIYVIEGSGTIALENKRPRLESGSYVYLPPGKDMQIKNAGAAPLKLLIFQKPYEAAKGVRAPDTIFANEREVKGQPFLGNEDARLQVLLPDDPAFDMAVNIFTYQPGATLPFVETHVMEHGLLMLKGQGVYRLENDYHPVQAGDVIWMGSYCPQWFVAMGKTPASYIYYKDVNREPM